jgi:hypothetical protein
MPAPRAAERRKAYVITRFPNSSTPSSASVCAFHEVMERSDQTDVTTTKPVISPEYSRSLSSEKERALIDAEWVRMRCVGPVGGGGAVMIVDQSVILVHCTF